MANNCHKEQIFYKVTQKIAELSGVPFFQALVAALAKFLKIRYVFITECQDFPTTRVRSIAFWADQGFSDNIEYELAGTPCEKVINGEICSYLQNIQQLFPRDKDLVTLNAESYIATPVLDPQNLVIGHFSDS